MLKIIGLLDIILIQVLQYICSILETTLSVRRASILDAGTNFMLLTEMSLQSSEVDFELRVKIQWISFEAK
jgi:hypothetical protein